MRRPVALIAGACLALAGCGGEEARPDRAARLVPADALAYVHVDLGDERLAELVERFPAVRRLVSALQALAGGDADRWAGDEAALALLDSGRRAGQALLLIEVEDTEAARAAVRSTGAVCARLVEGFLAVGQAAAVERAGRGRGLERTVEGDVDAWLPASGVRRVLGGNPLGAALDDPRLRFVTAVGELEDGGLRVRVRRARTGGGEAASFQPRLIERVPEDAAGYVGLGGAQPLLERLGVEALELGEVAIWVVPGLPAPTLSAAAELRGEPPAGALRRLRELGLAVEVADGLLLASTSAAALRRVPGEGDALVDGERFRRVLDAIPEEAEALGFADLAQLLEAGEQAGIAGGQTVAAVQEDLRRIAAVGFTAQREGSDTTAEFFFEIP